MRVLEEADLRWVSGGLCSFGNPDDLDVFYAYNDYGSAWADEVEAWNFWQQQVYGSQEWLDACTAYNAAHAAAQDAYQYYRALVDEQLLCQMYNDCLE